MLHRKEKSGATNRGRFRFPPFPRTPCCLLISASTIAAVRTFFVDVFLVAHGFQLQVARRTKQQQHLVVHQNHGKKRNTKTQQSQMVNKKSGLREQDMNTTGETPRAGWPDYTHKKYSKDNPYCREWEDHEHEDWWLADLCDIELANTDKAKNALKAAAVAQVNSDNFDPREIGHGYVMEKTQQEQAAPYCVNGAQYAQSFREKLLDDNGNVKHDAEAGEVKQMIQNLFPTRTFTNSDYEENFEWMCKMTCDYMGPECIIYSYGNKDYFDKWKNDYTHHCWTKAQDNYDLSRGTTGKNNIFSSRCVRRACDTGTWVLNQGGNEDLNWKSVACAETAR
ncbi:unnamed protein product [Amoebophrya sp. A120]|nr:unnamed protein product [Amoebophrya sp. A120]|eukprot:GSA120T00000733001.1